MNFNLSILSLVTGAAASLALMTALPADARVPVIKGVAHAKHAVGQGVRFASPRPISSGRAVLQPMAVKPKPGPAGGKPGPLKIFDKRGGPPIGPGRGPGPGQQFGPGGGSPVIYSHGGPRKSVPLPPPLAVATKVAPPFRVVREISVKRQYGPQYYGYGFHYTDEAAYPWIAFTAITLGVLSYMSEQQVRYHEEAQIRASSASIGETIIWENGSAQGYVTPTRQGVDRYGNTCREFHHYAYIDGREEEVYGTACRDANGIWRHVS